MSKLKVLIGAYACEPNRGSEPGVGWNWLRQMGQRHEIWVITRHNNRAVIEAELAKDPLPDAHFLYYDLPDWARFWKRKRRGLYLYYYLWQLGAYIEARRLHRQVQFDLVHHVTFVMYWMPSFLSLLPVPFVWGPVGGGEATPRAFLAALGSKGKLSERVRAAAQALGRLDPFVRMTARRSAVAFATTRETERRLQQLGCRNTAICSVMGLDARELAEVRSLGDPDPDTFRVASMGTLIAWKGVEFGLRAFAECQVAFGKSHSIQRAEYWVMGDGAERQRLTQLAADLGISERVRFLGNLPRPAALAKLAACDVLLLPSLHDSGGCVCTEAMAIGRPVVCLDLAGPAQQVTDETGIKIPAHSPEQVVRDLAGALLTLAADPALRRRMGEAGRARVEEVLNWDAKGRQFARVYQQVVSAGGPGCLNSEVAVYGD